MIEFQLSECTVSRGVPYRIHHVDDAAKVGKSVCVRKFFIINLDWSCVVSIQ